MYRKIIRAGAVLEIEVIEFGSVMGKKRTRSQKMYETPEEKRLINELAAKRKLSQIINANFRKKDLFISLTFDRDVTLEEAERLLKKFIRDMQKMRKLRNMEKLKYVVVTENKHQEDHRYHHHIVMSKIEMEIVQDMWPNGKVIQSTLFGKDFTGLAHYISKEAVEKGRRLWRQSIGLVLPEPERAAPKAGDRKLKPIENQPGYYKADEWIRWSDATGMHKYAKFIREGEIDLSTGGG